MAAVGGMEDDELGACGGSDNGAGAGPSGLQNGLDVDLDDERLPPSDKKTLKRAKKALRPRCQYGEDCYRKNPHHCADYCHPKDEDWASGDGFRPKPRCPFGNFCTRNNQRHQQYFHQSDHSAFGDVNNNTGDDDCQAPGSQGSDGSNGDVRPISHADFLAVRPKTKNNYAGAKGSASKKLKPSALGGSPQQSAAPNDGIRDSPNGPLGVGAAVDPAVGSGGDSPDDSQFECGCCFTDYPVTDSVACGEGHLFCQDCLKNYIQSIVYGGGKSTLSCLGPDCEATVSTIDLGFIEPKLLQRFVERQQRDMLAMAFGDAEDEKLHECPFCNFTCLVAVTTQVFQCFQCAKESCQYCRVEWKKHMDYGNNCNDVEGDDESKVRLKTEEAMTTALARKCPRCSALILKEDGCNFMTCQCGANFCYACRKPLSANDHLQHACVHLIPDDAQQVEQERLKGEQERVSLGAKGRKKIGGDVDSGLLMRRFY